jgi:hypothetical protein
VLKRRAGGSVGRPVGGYVRAPARKKGHRPLAVDTPSTSSTRTGSMHWCAPLGSPAPILELAFVLGRKGVSVATLCDDQILWPLAARHPNQGASARVSEGARAATVAVSEASISPNRSRVKWVIGPAVLAVVACHLPALICDARAGRAPSSSWRFLRLRKTLRPGLTAQPAS